MRNPSAHANRSAVASTSPFTAWVGSGCEGMRCERTRKSSFAPARRQPSGAWEIRGGGRMSEKRAWASAARASSAVSRWSDSPCEFCPHRALRAAHLPVPGSPVSSSCARSTVATRSVRELRLRRAGWAPAQVPRVRQKPRRLQEAQERTMYYAWCR